MSICLLMNFSCSVKCELLYWNLIVSDSASYVCRDYIMSGLLHCLNIVTNILTTPCLPPSLCRLYMQTKLQNSTFCLCLSFTVLEYFKQGTLTYSQSGV